MFDERRAARYLLWASATVVVGAALLALAIALIDPYALTRWISVSGLNRVKPALAQHQHHIKVAGARALNADVYLAGNSRVEVGIDPASAQLARFSAYNLAVSGSGISTARIEFAALRDARAPAPAVAIIGLEFADFLFDARREHAVSAALAPASTFDAIEWRIDTSLSINAAIDAVKTLTIQRDPEASIVSPRGFTPLNDYRRYVREGGYASIFRQRAQENARRLAHLPHDLVFPATGSSFDFDVLRDTLTRSDSRTTVHLLIYPYHAQLMEMLAAAGLAPVFAQWKALLVRELAALRIARPDLRVTLWDFSGYQPYQCERIPPAGDTVSQTQWYWEAGHFKAALGDKILARVLAPAPAREAAFGTMLGVDNLAANAARIARERAACLAAYPALFTDTAREMAALR